MVVSRTKVTLETWVRIFLEKRICHFLTQIEILNVSFSLFLNFRMFFSSIFLNNLINFLLCQLWLHLKKSYLHWRKHTIKKIVHLFFTQINISSGNFNLIFRTSKTFFQIQFSKISIIFLCKAFGCTKKKKLAHMVHARGFWKKMIF